MKTKQVVKDILKQQDITSWFQAIVNIETNELIGWEAFSKGPVGPCSDTPSLFNSVADAGIMKPFDLMCIHNAAKYFERLQLENLLFVNFSNEMLLAISRLKGQVGDLIAESQVPPTKMVLEIDESSARNNTKELIEAVHFFHTQGFQIAIDDLVDSIEDSQSLWAELKPDFVKIDRRFIKNINLDASKQKFVRGVVAVARSVNAKVIAEGVETKAELKTLRALGLHLIQGYLIHRPELSPLRPNLSDFDSTTKISNTKLACDLVTSNKSVPPQTLVKDVHKLFEEKVFISSLAVVENDTGHAIGMVYRSDFMNKFSSRQRRDVVEQKPISSEMNKEFLNVDSHLQLEQVSHLVTSKARIHSEQDFVISNQDKFLGVGTTIDLLRKITQLHQEPGQQLNQISMMPGSIPIGDCVNQLLEKGVQFTIVLFDLNHFKSFNNHYGHPKGDEILVIFSELLLKYFNQETDFTGHIGGDDFIVVIQHQDWKKTISSLLTEFNQRVIGFYSDKDQAKGGMQSTDRFGDDKFFEFINITGSIISITDEYFDSFQILLTDLIKLKQQSSRDESVCISRQHKNEIKLYSHIKGSLNCVISKQVVASNVNE